MRIPSIARIGTSYRVPVTALLGIADTQPAVAQDKAQLSRNDVR
jgi:hypothetical protein